MIPRLSLIASATLAWALSNPLPDPVLLTLSARWGLGVHASDLLPVVLITALWYRSFREEQRRLSNVDDWIKRYEFQVEPTTYQRPGDSEWLS